MTQKDAGQSNKTPRGHGEKVLLVEDDISVLNLTKRMVKGLRYRVLAATEPEQLLEMAREHTKDTKILITDVVMPQISGSKLAEKLIEISPETETLFMSGYTANVIAQHENHQKPTVHPAVGHFDNHY